MSRWSESQWRIVWRGSDPRPESVISPEQLPCSAYLYRYTIRGTIPLATLLQFPPITQLRGTFTVHFERAYKERVRTTFESIIVNIPGSGVPGYELVFWTLRYKYEAEERTFFHWLKIGDLSPELLYNVQPEQQMVFSFTKNELTAEISNESGHITLYHPSFTSTASRQNVARNLLSGERVRIIECSDEKYLNSSYPIYSNDGLGKITILTQGVDREGNAITLDWGQLPDDTKLGIAPTHAWVKTGIWLGDRKIIADNITDPAEAQTIAEQHQGRVEQYIGKVFDPVQRTFSDCQLYRVTVSGKGYYWYDKYKYNLTGESYFVLHSAISGVYTSTDNIDFFGEWGSSIINVPLSTGARVWVDEHTVGVPGIGRSGVVLWFYSLRAIPRICAVKAKTCRSIAALYTLSGVLRLARTVFIKGEECFVDVPLFSIQDDAEIGQLKNGMWYITAPVNGIMHKLTFSPELFVDVIERDDRQIPVFCWKELSTNKVIYAIETEIQPFSDMIMSAGNVSKFFDSEKQLELSKVDVIVQDESDIKAIWKDQHDKVNVCSLLATTHTESRYEPFLQLKQPPEDLLGKNCVWSFREDGILESFDLSKQEIKFWDGVELVVHRAEFDEEMLRNGKFLDWSIHTDRVIGLVSHESATYLAIFRRDFQNISEVGFNKIEVKKVFNHRLSSGRCIVCDDGTIYLFGVDDKLYVARWDGRVKELRKIEVSEIRDLENE